MRGLGLGAAGAILALSGCARTHPFREEMTWSDRAGTVRLAFRSAPDTRMVLTDTSGLLDHLRRHGAEAVSAEFEVHCDSGGTVDWFTLVAVDGYPVPVQSGGGVESEGRRLDAGPFAGACR